MVYDNEKVLCRRQTRITALDLIAFLAAEENPKQWLHMNEKHIDSVCSTIKDQNLRQRCLHDLIVNVNNINYERSNILPSLFACDKKSSKSYNDNIIVQIS